MTSPWSRSHIVSPAEPRPEPVYRCEHLLAQAEVRAGTKLLDQAQRIRELEGQLSNIGELEAERDMWMNRAIGCLYLVLGLLALLLAGVVL